MRRPYKRIGWPTIAGLGLVVVAFMVLSLLVTATGTARFAVAMGYDATDRLRRRRHLRHRQGRASRGVGRLLARRALGTAALLGIAWICLVAFSCLATHATVSTAISVDRAHRHLEDGGARQRQGGAGLGRAAACRPEPSHAAAAGEDRARGAGGERVPSGVWKDSQECGSIQESVHFARACAQVVQLRRELAAAQDYERLSARAAELRKGLAEAPIVATADPLPAAFSATLGRVLPIGGTEGVALLLTIVVELISCCGLAGIARLYGSREQHEGGATPAIGSLTGAGSEGSQSEREPPRQPRVPTLPKPSLRAVVSGGGRVQGSGSRDPNDAPSNVLPMKPRSPSKGLPQEGSLVQKTTLPSHVPAFVQQRLKRARGMSLAAKELRTVYEAWCATHGYEPTIAAKVRGRAEETGVRQVEELRSDALSGPTARRVTAVTNSPAMPFATVPSDRLTVFAVTAHQGGGPPLVGRLRLARL